MKRTIATISVLAALALAGCGGATAPSGPTTAEVQAHWLQATQAIAAQSSDGSNTATIDRAQVLRLDGHNATVTVTYTVQSNIVPSIKESKTMVEHVTVDNQGRITSGTYGGAGSSS